MSVYDAVTERIKELLPNTLSHGSILRFLVAARGGTANIVETVPGMCISGSSSIFARGSLPTQWWGVAPPSRWPAR
jgi:hypothetical protein